MFWATMLGGLRMSEGIRSLGIAVEWLDIHLDQRKPEQHFLEHEKFYF